ncbi:hypothetical protein DXG01_014299, partial [Tephrocybe rancida]
RRSEEQQAKKKPNLLVVAVKPEASLDTTSGLSRIHKCESCQRPFATAGALNYHARTCAQSKKRVGGALEKVRGAWNARKDKRRRLDVSTPSSSALNAQGNKPFPVALTNSTDNADEVFNAAAVLLPIPVAPAQLPFSADEPGPSESRRPRRPRVTPRRFDDYIPQQSMPLLNASIAAGDVDFIDIYSTRFLNVFTVPPGNPERSVHSHNAPADATPASESPVQDQRPARFKTLRNVFGLSRMYTSSLPPAHDPDDNTSLADMCDREPTLPIRLPIQQSSFHPYPNQSSFSLGNWYWNHGSQKSKEDFKILTDIVGTPGFSPHDIRDTPWTAINKTLGSTHFDGEEHQWEWEADDAGWHRTPVTLNVPFHKRMKNPGTHAHVVGDLYHRTIMSVIKEKLANQTDVDHFHYEPFELSWSPSPKIKEIRVHGELYTSPSVLDAHSELQALPPEPGCSLPRCVLPLMIWSDATHLTSFGSSKLWPAYLYIGSESKYRRCKPSLHLANHIAYFQALPDSFKDFVSEHIGGKGGPTQAFLAHCRRELFHTQWSILLDEEFLEAWEHGIVIICLDGIKRRFYPRIVTYSADYPEKALVASIRNGGWLPCPRCHVSKDHLGRMGMILDMERRTATIRLNDQDLKAKVTAVRSIIHQKGFAVNSKAVEAVLQPTSLVPAMNAFSNALGKFGFNHFQMLVVDILHEWEVGTWKAILIHLIRLVYESKGNNVGLLDARYRQIPTFGRDTIRKFSSNTSELKRLGARDFADLLQCAIPAFEGLLSEPHNTRLTELLFVCATWHGLAKLRVHTDDTLALLDEATLDLGHYLREFVTKTCSEFNTRELPREAEARSRQAVSAQKGKLKKTASQTLPISRNAAAPTVMSSGTTTRRPKALNLNTYKFHSLGDVAANIRRYGTTDSYSTEIGELEHRTVKARYKRTDRKAYSQQIARIERREAHVRRIEARTSPLDRADNETVRQATPDVHHVIGKTENLPLHVGIFVNDHAGDPAIRVRITLTNRLVAKLEHVTQDFIPKLKKHLLLRIKVLLTGLLRADGLESTPITELWQSVHMKNDRIYMHNILKVNFTTYDVRRGDDIIHINTSHRNVMVLNPFFTPDNGEHPYWYARVLGIYHANVLYLGEGNADYHPRRIEFLWVRWYSNVEDTSGWKYRRLDRVEFPFLSDPDSFGFLDPSDVLRACHIIPRFFTSKAKEDVFGVSKWAEDLEDWGSYYVNRFVDRDMVMRYHWGLAIGHVYSHPTSPSVIRPDHGRQQRPEEAHEHSQPQADHIGVDPHLPINLDKLLSTLHTLDGMDAEVEEGEEDGFDEDGVVPEGDDDDWHTDSGEDDEDHPAERYDF